MRKSNWIILAVLLIASIAFLILWFALDFNLVDDPVDLAITIVWWVVIAAACVIIHVAEERRRRSIRTSFIGSAVIYNTEAGFVHLDPAEPFAPALQKMLSGLDYDLDHLHASDKSSNVRFNYVVRSNKFKDNGKVWEGEVVKVSQPDVAQAFSNRSELASLLGAAA